MKVGKIISIEFDKFKVRLFNTTSTSVVTIEGRVYYFGNIGSYLKVRNVLGDQIICEITAVLDYVSSSNASSTYNLDSNKEYLLKPIGTLDSNGSFSMGVSIFPSLYSDVEIVLSEDLDNILLTPDNSERGKIHNSFFLGKSRNMLNYDICLNVDKFFNIHTAVIGNTGSGKSNTITHILQEILRMEDNSAIGSKIIIFDTNGEYKRAFSTDANLSKEIKVSFMKPNLSKDTDENYQPFYLPYFLLNLDEWLSFLMASERVQKPFWDQVLQESYKFYKIKNAESDEILNEFSNYIKWKIWNMIKNICDSVTSDTTKMTSIKGVIASIHSLVNQFVANDVTKGINDIKNFLTAFEILSSLNYGNNEGAVSESLKKVIQDGEKPEFVHIVDNKKLKECLMESDDSFSKINVEQALSTANKKLLPGEYFDYTFLKHAAEMVLIDEGAKGNLRVREFTSTMLTRLDYFMHNPECEFMRDEANNKFINPSDYLTKVFNISDNKIPQTQLFIIDTSEIGMESLELLTSVVCRLIFDYRKKLTGEKRRHCPIHLVMDEAHRYIKKDTSYILKENIYEKIAREGRKYSMYLLISSQRPSELSPTVLSQCGNYIVHRIQNEVDMKYVYSVLPFFSDDFVNILSFASEY